MSICISSKQGVKARKTYRCCLCGERINAGDKHDTRTGVEAGDGFWKMRMHPECHAYEQTPEMRRNLQDWYEDVIEPAFDRKDAKAHRQATTETILR